MLNMSEILEMVNRWGLIEIKTQPVTLPISQREKRPDQKQSIGFSARPLIRYRAAGIYANQHLSRTGRG